ncbi:glycoside hydrolase family 32 protein [Halobacillus sp. H74]|uniref:glycoside hydrolase family 32 protein n=1 Tax=Halobacillus sp. H74 TaxID=3457436 RepID=UPI003FCC8FF5
MKSLWVVVVSVTLVLTACNEESSKVEESNENELQSIKAEPSHNADEEYYTEKFRPQYHFSAERGNLADPNGLVYFKGEYHLFFQQNGQWGHAVSKDLIHWKHLDLALTYGKLGQSLSGSVVVDENDTSGFFDGESGLVAIYTNSKDGIESQSIAYSRDNGRTWKKYEGNPVINNPDIKDFRDPKVIWHEETKKWVMVVSTNKTAQFYSSKNLKDWEYLSEFGSGEGLQTAVWECPSLFQLPVDGDSDRQKWVLHVSVGDNEVTNGSTAQYFIGEFDGKKFTNDYSSDTVLTTDYGKDFYAAQTYSNLPEDRGQVWLGWMSNWRYPYQVPTEPWMGAMSIPRKLQLITNDSGDIRLIQKPVEELNKLRQGEINYKDLKIDGSKTLEGVKGTAFEFKAEMSWEDADQFGLKVRKSSNEETIIGYDVVNKEIYVDRSNAGLSTLVDRNGDDFQFGSKYTAPLVSSDNTITIHGYVDESSIELFVNDGERVLTNLIYPESTSDSIELFSNNGETILNNFTFYPMKSVWRKNSENKLSRLVVNEKSLDIEIGEEKQLKAITKPDWVNSDDADISWEIADDQIAELKQKENGTYIKGLQKGATSVKVSYKNISETIEVFVFK